ncbi:hypothetical protein ANABIO32_03290 [Rossellomorea marisflavi]|nr:hypothetical protein ANABIO32_03290 [Rossellomorea marisflavi]
MLNIYGQGGDHHIKLVRGGAYAISKYKTSKENSRHECRKNNGIIILFIPYSF